MSVLAISIAVQTKLAELFGPLRDFTQVIIFSNFTTAPSFRRLFLCLFGNLSLIVFCLFALQMFKRTNFNSPFRPSLFFLKKRLRFQIQEQALITFAAQFLSENLGVV